MCRESSLLDRRCGSGQQDVLLLYAAQWDLMLVFHGLVTEDDNKIWARPNKYGMVLVAQEIRLTIVQENGTWSQDEDSHVTSKHRKERLVKFRGWLPVYTCPSNLPRDARTSGCCSDLHRVS